MLPNIATALPTYDCMVLSGGGAKGAYGAGVAKAVAAYRKKKGLNNPICYIGASAGALNAYLLAAEGADALIAFWLSATNRSVLGVRFKNPKFQALCHWVARWSDRRQPFSIYANRALTHLIHTNAHLKDLKAPLIIACTDYTEGKLKAFYVSPLIEKIVAEDAKQSANRQRLGHLRRIDTDRVLTYALLASAAIPIFFPPVKIKVDHNGNEETSWYVDGGVGNHTPTREAGYFLRYLEEMGLGKKGVVFCVKQDPPRILQEGPQRLAFVDILKRTLDVYHHVHMEPIIRAWIRINIEVAEQHSRVDRFKQWLDKQQLDQTTSDQIARHLTDEFVNLGGHAPRVDVPLIEIEPATQLGDSLDFNPERAKQDIEHGYNNTLKVLRDANSFDDAEYRELLNSSIFPEAVR